MSALCLSPHQVFSRRIRTNIYLTTKEPRIVFVHRFMANSTNHRISTKLLKISKASTRQDICSYYVFQEIVLCGLHVCSNLFIYFNSVLRAFQDYFSSYETGQSVGGRKRENPEKNHMTHPQAELGLSHIWPVRGSNPHQTRR